MEAMALGFIAAVILVLSACYSRKKPVFGLLGGIAAIPLTLQAAYFWTEMLIMSGKDTTLLGFKRYPTAFIIFCALLFLSAFVIILSIITVIKQKSNDKLFGEKTK